MQSNSSNATELVMLTATDIEFDERMVWCLVWYLVVLPALFVAPAVLGGCKRRLHALGGAVEKSPSLEVNASTSASAVQLQAAEQAKKRLHARVSGAVWQVGWMLLHLGYLPWYASYLVHPLGAPAVIDPQPIVGSYILHCLPAPFGLALLTLSVQPIEALRIRNLLICWIFVSLACVMLFHQIYETYNAGLRGVAIMLMFIALSCLVIVVVALHSLFGHRCFGGDPQPPRRQLRRLWAGVRLLLFVWGAGFVVAGSFRFLCFDSICLVPPRDHIITGVPCTILSLIITPGVRGRVTRWLGSLGKSGTAEQQAASVASLLGDTSVAQALTDAAQRFRGLRLSKVTRAALMNNQPDPSLYALTEAAVIGEVHAFMSHSWSDDGSQKYDKLNEWAHELGGDVDKRIWLDKACIDQLNIDASLACLPVFLSGCKQLLMLVGSTYTSRLWCVMETFIFFQGRHDNSTLLSSQLAIKLLGDDVSLDMLMQFDAANAKVRHDRDRQKLLAVIEASFGTTAPFNKLVVTVFNEQLKGLVKEPTRRRSLLTSRKVEKTYEKRAATQIAVDLSDETTTTQQL